MIHSVQNTLHCNMGWLFLTSMVTEVVRGQKLYSDRTIWHIMFGWSHRVISLILEPRPKVLISITCRYANWTDFIIFQASGRGWKTAQNNCYSTISTHICGAKHERIWNAGFANVSAYWWLRKDVWNCWLHKHRESKSQISSII